MTDPVVRAHLLNVVTALRSAPPPDPARRDARALALDALDAYARAGRFPRPDGPVAPRPRRVEPPRAFRGPGARAPIFEDAAGTRCAVGHLLGLTRPDLVARVRDADNGVYVPELDAPEVDAWAAENGLTRDELAWIQPEYCSEIQTCDEIVLEAPPAASQVCEGPDASFGDVHGLSLAQCQECDGPFKVWAWVTNRGTEPVQELSVTLGAGDQTFDEAAGGQVGPGEVVRVGPLEADSVTQMNGEGWLRVSTAEDCHPDDELMVWEYGNGGPGHVEPTECGGGCPDSGGADTGGGCGTGPWPDEDGAPDAEDGAGADTPPAGGCGGGAAGLLALGVLAAGGRRRDTIAR